MSLNILIIQGGANKKLPSGEQTVIMNESAYLSKDNIVNVEYIDNGRTVFERLLGLTWSHGNYKRVLKLIDKYKPDIVHYHTIVPYLSLSVLFAAKRRRVKTVQTLHNGRWICVEGGFVRKGVFCDKCVGNKGLYAVLYGCQNGRVASLLLVMTNLIFGFLQNRYKLIDKFIAVSGFIRDKHIETGFCKSDVLVNNNGIDIELVDKIKSDCNVNMEPNSFIFSGRVSKAKGSEVLKFLMPLSEKYKFHIIGDGPELNSLIEFSKKHQYKGVFFWGRQDYKNTLKIMSRGVCTVVPSQMGEPFGLTAAESMALGVPVVSSDVGELRNLVNSGGGVVVHARDFSQFERSIESFLSDKNKAKSTGQRGRAYIENNLTAHLRVKSLLNIYKDL